MPKTKRQPGKKRRQDRVPVYPPPVIASMLSLLAMNSTEQGTSFPDFPAQLKSTLDLAADLEASSQPGSETFRSAVDAIAAFYKKDATRKALVDDAHKAIAAMMTALAADGAWGGCKFISQTRIKQIVSLP
jgi:hypothetical protein